MVVGGKRGGPAAGIPTPSDLWANGAGGSDEWRCAVPGSDVRVITSGGRAIEAHSSVLAAASPVLEARLFRRPPKRHHDGSAILPITGVPCDAVLAFLRCLYHGKTAASWLSPQPAGHDGKGSRSSSGNHAVHLLVLSHAMRVPWLKRAAESSLASSLRAEDVADLLQLSRLCDAARLKVRCLNYIRKDPEAVEATEGWRLLRRCDPRIEAEVARFVKDARKREQRRRKRREEENTAYVELGDAVECMHHILREGCGGVGPKDDSKQLPPPRRPAPMDGRCRWGPTCEGIKALIRHYATCQQRTSRRRDAAGSSLAGGSTGCGRCGRMVQLLRLHAAVSFELDHPMPQPMSSVCTLKPEDEDGNGIKWRLLARKVVCAKLMSALTLSKRKREYADQGCPRANSRPWRNQGAAA